jgi:hypothetical protein
VLTWISSVDALWDLQIAMSCEVTGCGNCAPAAGLNGLFSFEKRGSR